MDFNSRTNVKKIDAVEAKNHVLAIYPEAKLHVSEMNREGRVWYSIDATPNQLIEDFFTYYVSTEDAAWVMAWVEIQKEMMNKLTY